MSMTPLPGETAQDWLIREYFWSSEIEHASQLEMQQGTVAAVNYLCKEAFGAAGGGRVSEMQRMTFGSLFAGIGGFDLGLERAGMECKWQVEVDPFCQKVLASHWPQVKQYGDIKECGKHNLEPVDLICGGFPCQPFSVAGKRGGTEDDRYLWPEMLRVISELKPTWVIGENVPGIIQMALEGVLSDLENQGYECQALLIPACGVDAPHRRNRVWVVAYRNARECLQQTDEVPARGYAPNDGCTTVAYTESERPGEEGKLQCPRSAEWITGGCEAVANSICLNDDRGGYGASAVFGKWGATSRLSGCAGVSYANSEPMGRVANPRSECCEWLPEPSIRRVADGIPHRVDRLRALGNAVVPQIPEILGRMIMDVHNDR